METSITHSKTKGVCPPSDRKYNKSDCCLKPETPPKQPDPGMYSQQQNFLAGQPMTWDSPDITTNLTGGVDEDVVVTVRNYSSDSAAVGVYVKVAYSQFGIGFPRQTLNILQTNLNKQGLAGAEAEIKFPLPQSVKDEWSNISTFVTIEHPHDRDDINNLGEQSWSSAGSKAGSTHQFQFPIYNSLSAAETFSLQVLESDWSPGLSTNAINLIPGQSANITLSLSPPAGTNETKRFNVVALRSNGQLYGGVFHRLSVSV